MTNSSKQATKSYPKSHHLTDKERPTDEFKPIDLIRPGKIKPLNCYISYIKLSSSIVRLLALVTPYIESEILGLSRIVKKGDVCIDIGAAAGLYTLELSRLIGPKGKVLSVEPLDFARPLFSYLLGGKQQANVTLNNIALGSEHGESIIRVPVGQHGYVTGRSFLALGASGLGSNSEFSRHQDIKVNVSTIDNLCSNEKIERLDFIKIDIEGAELAALQGGQKYIEQFKPSILIEIEARHLKRFGYTPNDIVNWLKKRGYTMYIWRKGWQITDKVTLGARNYLFQAQQRS